MKWSYSGGTFLDFGSYVLVDRSEVGEIQRNRGWLQGVNRSHRVDDVIYWVGKDQAKSDFKVENEFCCGYIKIKNSQVEIWSSKIFESVA